MPSTNRHSGRSAAVTGAGGGLGRDIALGLAAKGYVVFGTAMSAAEVQDLKEASGGRVSLTVCDMTKEDSVKAWAAGVSDALGEFRPRYPDQQRRHSDPGTDRGSSSRRHPA